MSCCDKCRRWPHELGLWDHPRTATANAKCPFKRGYDRIRNALRGEGTNPDNAGKVRIQALGHVQLLEYRLKAQDSVLNATLKQDRKWILRI